MVCVIIQPSFLPWRGFFHLVQKSDVFVHYDDVRYSKHSWRNRNKIATSQGVDWITVPVESKGCLDRLIYDTRIVYKADWQKKIMGQIYMAYRKAEYFNRYYQPLEDILTRKWEFIADLDIACFDFVCKELHLEKKTIRSKDLGLKETDPVKRLVEACNIVGANKYISGPTAIDYIKDDSLFSTHGIQLEFMKYPDYSQYKQCFDYYDPYVSIIDLFF